MSEILPAEAPGQLVKSWKEYEHLDGNEFVKINYEMLDELAARNPDLDQPDWRFPGMHPENDWAFAVQVTTADAINYMFLNRDIERLGESWTMKNPAGEGNLSGSNALLTRMNQISGEAEDISAGLIEELAGEQGFESFLPGIPMAETRRKKLADFALGLRNGYGGSVRELLESSIDNEGNFRIFNDGRGLTERLLSDQFGDVFTDTGVITVDGHDLIFPYNKRANLTPILIDGRARTSDTLPRFSDIDKSGSVIDYRLPQALRELKVIEYSDLLAWNVDNYVEIEAGSHAENEIRGASAYAVAYLLEKINEIRENNGKELYNMAHIDFWLWKLGRELKKNGSTSLPHFTETTAY